jgi:CheY-like chemotaxis protein
MDGYAVARALRAGRETSAIPLVALTGYAAPEDRRRAIEAGFDHHFGKPADLVKLAALLAAAPRSHAAPPRV